MEKEKLLMKEHRYAMAILSVELCLMLINKL